MNQTLILEAPPMFSEASDTAKTTDARSAARRTAEHISILGRQVRVDVVEPADGEALHTILLLHGVGGLLGDGGLMRRAARGLAAHGFRADVVHYFNVTGTFFATHASAREHAELWKTALVEIAQHYVHSQGAPVGLMGYSLGGTLAMVAAQDVPGVGAVAVMASGLDEQHQHWLPTHLPSLLVLHGGHDVKVPPELAEALARTGRRAGALVESVIYPEEGHVFGARAERDALDRAAEFFSARLETGAEP